MSNREPVENLSNFVFEVNLGNRVRSIIILRAAKIDNYLASKSDPILYDSTDISFLSKKEY